MVGSRSSGWSAPDAFWPGDYLKSKCESVFGKYLNIFKKLLATPPHWLQQPLQWSTPFLLDWHIRPAAGESGNWSIMMVSSSQTLKVAGPRYPSPMYRVCTEHRQTHSQFTHSNWKRQQQKQKLTKLIKQPHLGPENKQKEESKSTHNLIFLIPVPLQLLSIILYLKSLSISWLKY